MALTSRKPITENTVHSSRENKHHTNAEAVAPGTRESGLRPNPAPRSGKLVPRACGRVWLCRSARARTRREKNPAGGTRTARGRKKERPLLSFSLSRQKVRFPEQQTHSAQHTLQGSKKTSTGRSVCLSPHFLMLSSTSSLTAGAAGAPPSLDRSQSYDPTRPRIDSTGLGRPRIDSTVDIGNKIDPPTPENRNFSDPSWGRGKTTATMLLQGDEHGLIPAPGALKMLAAAGTLAGATVAASASGSSNSSSSRSSSSSGDGGGNGGSNIGSNSSGHSRMDTPPGMLSAVRGPSASLTGPSELATSRIEPGWSKYKQRRNRPPAPILKPTRPLPHQIRPKSPSGAATSNKRGADGELNQSAESGAR